MGPDPAKIKELAEILTVEIEHVDVGALNETESAFSSKGGKKLEIHPSPRMIGIIQDKYRQKEHLTEHGCPVVEYTPINAALPATSIENAANRLGLPLMLKSRTLAYDGRGNFVLNSIDQIDEALSALGGGGRALYAEKWMSFKKEITVMVVRGRDGEIKSYPAVETLHKGSICHLVFIPLRSGDVGLAKRACEVAENAVKTFEGAGVFGIEMFLMEDGTLYINEIAPRPHNSGHYTVRDLPVPSAAMLNLIGHSPSMQEY
ncbi:hypothetical protein AX17_004267 [Amanita inopinata Kibby_2008]|nr:hypothetical protein AX17_004267 [Amanita inopinata Kibby_2008]